MPRTVAPPPLSVEITVEAGDWPADTRLHLLVERAVEAAIAEIGAELSPGSELGVTFTDDEGIRRLNGRWRGHDKPTNVLSFPASPHAAGRPLPPLLGDIVVAWETVAAEAQAERKRLEDHLTHLVVHGFLHLAGFDHETDEEAEAMEGAERRILAKLAIADPYA